jgi:hypothetical protein
MADGVKLPPKGPMPVPPYGTRITIEMPGNTTTLVLGGNPSGHPDYLITRCRTGQPGAWTVGPELSFSEGWEHTKDRDQIAALLARMIGLELFFYSGFWDPETETLPRAWPTD